MAPGSYKLASVLVYSEVIHISEHWPTHLTVFRLDRGDIAQSYVELIFTHPAATGSNLGPVLILNSMIRE